jgi:hypothetical protein
VDEAMVFDNSGVNPDLVFVKSTDQSIRVINKIKFTLLQDYYYENA